MKRYALMFCLLAAVQQAQADDLKVPRNALWEKECGACHVLFPPQLLTADNWKAMMDGLARHFGSNAELDAKERKAITDFLVENAGIQARHHSASLRITETVWFKREHRSVSPKEWVHPDVKTPSNCKACHNVVGHTSWSERDLRTSGQRHGDDD
ncbi:MAG: cytochrome C [Pseudomonadota bacterium]